MVKRIIFELGETDGTPWSEVVDKFFLNVTPPLFEWLKWVFILGALQAAAFKTNDATVRTIVYFLYIFLFFYVNVVFSLVEFHGFPLIESEKKWRTISIIISGLLTYGTYFTLTHFVALIAGTGT